MPYGALCSRGSIPLQHLLTDRWSPARCDGSKGAALLADVGTMQQRPYARHKGIGMTRGQTTSQSSARTLAGVIALVAASAVIVQLSLNIDGWRQRADRRGWLLSIYLAISLSGQTRLSRW